MILSGWVLVIVASYLVVEWLDGECQEGPCAAVSRFFDLDGEANLPAWFSSMIWLGAGALAALLSHSDVPDRRRWRLHWIGIAVISVFLSLDEAALFHERFGSTLGGLVGAERVLFYNWIFYGLAMVALVALIYLPFLLRIDRGTALRMILAGIVFVSGSLGLEMLGAASRVGAISLIEGRMWLVEITLEETLEMLGVILFIHALLFEFQRGGRAIRISTR
ncbi:hypothetical protein MWU52_00085 [Jannaschia sp. S6380]|uniref:hypothetical protein n=1 Tax=Jannaschia sp. S6380 TaxID=2926408 RepID=UPI001FF45D4A|nr:hypothetical protein [Jannaschia sp. S6380]MCK0165938.1 hypothetical protein [Jannaschia sp. S6380]